MVISAFETGGGIANALDQLGQQPFLLLNGDIWTDFALDSIRADKLPANKAAWLLMVDNPKHNPRGDFGLVDGVVSAISTTKYTFSGVSIIRPQLVIDFRHSMGGQASFPLRNALLPAIERGAVTGTFYKGQWCDVGTPERYQALNESLGELEP